MTNRSSQSSGPAQPGNWLAYFIQPASRASSSSSPSRTSRARWGLVARGLGGTGVREAPSKKTSLRWALKEATARNQPWPGVDDRHYGAREIGLMEPLETPSN